MKVVSDPSTVKYFTEKYASCEIRYGDLKKQLAEDIIKFTEPVRERILELSANDAYLSKVARIGAEKAHESGAKTVNEVRDIIGFRKF
jgi:tryptophanyl-tRNA synthetase